MEIWPPKYPRSVCVTRSGPKDCVFCNLRQIGLCKVHHPRTVYVSPPEIHNTHGSDREISKLVKLMDRMCSLCVVHLNNPQDEMTMNVLKSQFPIKIDITLVRYRV